MSDPAQPDLFGQVDEKDYDKVVKDNRDLIMALETTTGQIAELLDTLEWYRGKYGDEAYLEEHGLG